MGSIHPAWLFHPPLLQGLSTAAEPTESDGVQGMTQNSLLEPEKNICRNSSDLYMWDELLTVMWFIRLNSLATY